jgi:hypothetical protein
VIRAAPTAILADRAVTTIAVRAIHVEPVAVPVVTCLTYRELNSANCSAVAALVVATMVHAIRAMKFAAIIVVPEVICLICLALVLANCSADSAQPVAAMTAECAVHAMMYNLATLAVAKYGRFLASQSHSRLNSIIR